MGEIADYYIDKQIDRHLNIGERYKRADYLDFIWTTKDGNSLRPENMETSHIENILKCKTLSCGELDREMRRIFLGELALRKETL